MSSNAVGDAHFLRALVVGPGGAPGLHRNDISGPWFARIEECAHVNDGAGFLVRIMRGGNGDVSMPEKLRRRKDAVACYHD